jgi:hypothetical protein
MPARENGATKQGCVKMLCKETIASMTRTSYAILTLAWLIAIGAVAAEPPPRSVPIIYVTDLYHPHDDPDDHFDLATLFGIPAFDIKAIVIDTGTRGLERPGFCAIRQMMHITGDTDIPYATGLKDNLKSQADRAEDQPKEAQEGVELILKALRESEKPVTLFATGSLRDLAAACNREPALFQSKVARFYVNAGDTAGIVEWNVGLDPHAFVRIMNSSLPVYWMPCFGADGYETFWQFRQADVLETAPPPLQNYIVYALSKAESKENDPIAAMNKPVPAEVRDRFWPETRNMWCTAGFLHAVGREDPTFTFKKVSEPVNLSGFLQRFNP